MPKGVTHGMSYTPTYKSWEGMKARCYNPQATKYQMWGGRGITVCEAWLKFENFYADMGERPPGTSIDRIDNDGNYEPGNCRWATPLEQGRNVRNYRGGKRDKEHDKTVRRARKAQT